MTDRNAILLNNPDNPEGGPGNFWDKLFPKGEDDQETPTPTEAPTIPEEGTQPEETEAREETTVPEETTSRNEESGDEKTGKAGKKDKDAVEGDLHEIIGVTECPHPWLHGVTIGLGGLSLVLIVVVILQAIRLHRMKRIRTPKLAVKPPVSTEMPGNAAPKKSVSRPVSAAAPAAPVIQAPAETVQVGKLHALGDRESQQDCLAVSPQELYNTKGLLAIVADGMGGLSDGDRMSQTAASAMMNSFMANRENTPDTIYALAAEANQAVNRLLGPQNQGRSGSTLVAGIVKDGLFHYISVGDSRICLYRQGALTQLNREHVYRNELIVQAINGSGTLWDASTHPKAAGLTSFLGMGNLKYVDTPAEPVKLRGGDKIILMSDGVYNALSLLELETALMKPAQEAADAIGQMIHTKAYRHQDNYTAVILEF